MSAEGAPAGGSRSGRSKKVQKVVQASEDEDAPTAKTDSKVPDQEHSSLQTDGLAASTRGMSEEIFRILQNLGTAQTENEVRFSALESQISAIAQFVQEQREVQTSSLPQATGGPGVANGRHFARPQDFDGSVPWSSYLVQFEAIAEAHRWTPGDRVGELVACLRGPALEVFAHLPTEDRRDYDRLVCALEQRFGPGRQEPWFRSQFRRRVRAPGEGLAVLARDIEQLAFHAYPAAVPSLRDSLACDQFIEALSDVDLQVAVKQSRPDGLQEALATAVEIEAIRRSARVAGQYALCSMQ